MVNLKEKYSKFILPPSHRSAVCKFCIGVASMGIENGMYKGLPEQAMTCPFCN
jgi:hypothetical protein